MYLSAVTQINLQMKELFDVWFLFSCFQFLIPGPHCSDTAEEIESSDSADVTVVDWLADRTSPIPE